MTTAAIAVAIGVGAYWIMTPDFLQTRVLKPLQEATGIAVTVEDLDLGLQGIELRGVALYDPSTLPPQNPNDTKEATPVDGEALLRIQEITLQPSLANLLHGHIRIPKISLTGLQLTIRRDASGRSNLDQLLEVLPKTESSDASPSGSVQFDLHAVHLYNARLRYIDSFERGQRPLQIDIGIEDLSLSGLDTTAPWTFALSSQIEIGSDTRSTIKATGKIHQSPLLIETDLALSEIDVDTLVENLATGDDDEVAAIDTGTTAIRAKIAVGRVRYQGIDFTDAKGTLSLDESTLSFPEVTASVAAGRARIAAKVSLGVTDLAYSGSLSLSKIQLAKVGGLLGGIPWGNVEPIASIEGKLSMAGTTGRRLLDTLSLDLEADIDQLDVGAWSTPSDDGPAGAWDTGRGADLVGTSRRPRCRLRTRHPKRARGSGYRRFSAQVREIRCHRRRGAGRGFRAHRSAQRRLDLRCKPICHRRAGINPDLLLRQ